MIQTTLSEDGVNINQVKIQNLFHIDYLLKLILLPDDMTPEI